MRWVKVYINDMCLMNEKFRDDNGNVDFEALGREEYQFRRALILGDTKTSERARAALAEVQGYIERGKKGAAARWREKPAREIPEGQKVKSQKSVGGFPTDKQLVLDYAVNAGLDYNDAYECWDCTVNERAGKTADGKKIQDWKAYMSKWCKSRAENRRNG